jgi:hypothetical protein
MAVLAARTTSVIRTKRRTGLARFISGRAQIKEFSLPVKFLSDDNA